MPAQQGFTFIYPSLYHGKLYPQQDVTIMVLIFWSLTLIPLVLWLVIALRLLQVLRFGKSLSCDLQNISLKPFLVYRRRAAGTQVVKPNSSRAAGAGGSSNTMLKLYTDDSPGLRVYVSTRLHYKWRNDIPCDSDPFIVLVLSLSFIGSIFFLHISAKVIRAFTK